MSVFLVFFFKANREEQKGSDGETDEDDVQRICEASVPHSLGLYLKLFPNGCFCQISLNRLNFTFRDRNLSLYLSPRESDYIKSENP